MSNIVKVVFFLQRYECWVAWESVYQAMKQDYKVDPCIVLLYGDKFKKASTKKILEQEKIPYIDYKDYNVDKEKPDIAFIQDPFELVRPDDFNTQTLIDKKIPIAYIHYAFGMNSSYKYKQKQFNMSVQNNAWKVFVRSEQVKELFGKHCDNSNKHIAVTGHPVTDAIINIDNFTVDMSIQEKAKNKKIILWNPHHDIDREEQYSTFSSLWKTIINIFEKDPSIFLLIRPHPLLFTKILRSKDINSDEIRNFLNIVNKQENIMLDNRYDYRHAFSVSDGMISDASSLLLSYVFTKKPILYLKNKNNSGFHSCDEEFISSYYTYKQKTDISKFINMVKNNEDKKINERLSKINKYFYKPDGNAGIRIKNYILEHLLKEDNKI